MATPRKENPQKAGRKSLYDPRIHPVIALCAARMGGGVPAIARECGVSEFTVRLWDKSFPKFSKALREGKEFADSKVVNAVFRRAVGYEYEELQVESSGNSERTKRTTKRVVPDVDAQKFWLTNRQPAHWSNKKEFSGPGGGPIETKQTTEVRHVVDFDKLNTDLDSLVAERANRGSDPGDTRNAQEPVHPDSAKPAADALSVAADNP